jgi:hypothetical protein
MDSFTEIFNLVVTKKIIDVMEKNSKQLQNESLTASEAHYAIKLTKNRIESLRTDNTFEEIVEEVTDISGLRLECDSKKRRIAPKNYMDCFITTRLPGNTSSRETDLRNSLRGEFFDTLDCLKNSMNERFDLEALDVLMRLENLIVDSSNRLYDDAKFDENDYLIKLNKSSLIDLKRLKEDCRELPVHIKLYNIDAKLENKINHISTIEIIYKLFGSNPNTKIAMPQLHRLLKFMKTVAVSSATAERNFSVLRRLKIWTRSAMHQNTLTNRMFAMIHKTVMDRLDIGKIAREFISRSQQRRNYFGH